MKIDYYYSLMSPWAYLGAPRFYALQKKYCFFINHFPLDIMRLFPLSGGLPLSKRAEQRKIYRMLELKRWQKRLKIPINYNPKFFPPSDVSRASLIILSIDDPIKQNQISLKFLSQMWQEDKDIGEEKNLRKACSDLELNFEKINEIANSKVELYESLADKAASLNIFGSPTYVLNKEIFWGQDRLDFLEESILENLS
tara:strand:- start:152 stop:745 length:594 start_codon:yes stop_codon:yes gene_type:complete